MAKFLVAMGRKNCRDRRDMMLLPHVSYSLRDVAGLRDCGLLLSLLFFPTETKVRVPSAVVIFRRRALSTFPEQCTVLYNCGSVSAVSLSWHVTPS